VCEFHFPNQSEFMGSLPELMLTCCHWLTSALEFPLVVDEKIHHLGFGFKI
jgi:hypothetical protein